LQGICLEAMCHCDITESQDEKKEVLNFNKDLAEKVWKDEFHINIQITFHPKIKRKEKNHICMKKISPIYI